MIHFFSIASARPTLVLLLALITATATAATTATSAHNGESNPLNDLVRILAGLPVSEQSRYADLMRSSAWQRYHEQIQQTWERYDKQQHAKVEAFREQWLPVAVHQDRDLLYPFAGADFLYADLFFHKATNIYMFGLEPLGEIPGRERLNSAYYNGVIRATEDLLRLTFFRTKAMREDFLHNGTVPLLSYFIVHRGHVIKDITYLRLDENGIPHEAPVAEATGARIAFQDARSTRMRALWYWRGDLSNRALANHPGLERYLSDLPPSNLYMKAASYLCHHQGFEDACTLFRDRARLSLQEDSGMPLRFFSEDDWTRTFFGEYRDPISVFTDRLYRQQNALRDEFKKTDNVHELPFPLGYHVASRADNLMLAIRTDPDPATELPQAPEPPQTQTQKAPEKAAPEPVSLKEANPSPPTPPQVQAKSEPVEPAKAEPKQPQPQQPARSIQEQLDAAGIAYKTNDTGNIWLIQTVDNSRTQLTFIAAETKPIRGLAMRDIWSVGYLSDDDSLSIDTTTQLLKDNASTNLGAWELGRFVGKAAGIFRARIPAETDVQALATVIQDVSTTADRKERELMGNDEL